MELLNVRDELGIEIEKLGAWAKTLSIIQDSLNSELAAVDSPEVAELFSSRYRIVYKEVLSLIQGGIEDCEVSLCCLYGRLAKTIKEHTV